MRHPGGLGSFLCDLCPQDITVYTASDHVEMVVNWLNANGNAVRFREDVQIRVVGTNRQFLNTTSTSTTIVTINLFARRTVTELIVSSPEWVRSVRFVKDAIAPRVQIELLAEIDGIDYHEYIILISFTEAVVWDPQPSECPEMQRIDRRGFNSTDLAALSERCSTNLLEKGVENGVTVRGGAAEIVVINDYAQMYVVVQTESLNRSADVEIIVNEGYTDFAGNALAERARKILYYRPFPRPRARQLRLLQREVNFPQRSYFNGRVAGQVATVAVASASAATFASSACIVFPLQHLSDLFVLASGGTGNGGSITMLNNVQKLHMTGKMGIWM